jgi:hypothetical protein
MALFFLLALPTHAQELRLTVHAVSHCEVGDRIDLTWQVTNLSHEGLLLGEMPTSRDFSNDRGEVTQWPDQAPGPLRLLPPAGSMSGNLSIPAWAEKGKRTVRLSLGFQLSDGRVVRLSSNLLSFQVSYPEIPQNAKPLANLPHIRRLEILGPATIRLSSEGPSLTHLGVDGGEHDDFHFIDVSDGSVKNNPTSRAPQVLTLERCEGTYLSSRRDFILLKFLGVRQGRAYFRLNDAVVKVEPY